MLGGLYAGLCHAFLVPHKITYKIVVQKLHAIIAHETKALARIEHKITHAHTQRHTTDKEEEEQALNRPQTNCYTSFLASASLGQSETRPECHDPNGGAVATVSQ